MVAWAIAQLVQYAIAQHLIEQEDATWACNALLAAMDMDAPEPTCEMQSETLPPLHEILEVLVSDCARRGIIDGDSITQRDWVDTKLMACLTPRPSAVHAAFQMRYMQSPEQATTWFYDFSKRTNYIRINRMAKDMVWLAPTPYGDLRMTINLAKPEKDPKAIAAQKNSAPTTYPRCPLCVENEGYAGRMDHPARGNHRMIPVNLCGESWFFQYSPYSYYNEHAIVLSGEHQPMQIDKSCFAKLLAFAEQFPHYFVGSNADLPIVGGSILSHEHFQAGRFEFPMAQSKIETPMQFVRYPMVWGGIVKWPMSVIRISSREIEPLIMLADEILSCWKTYTDPDAEIIAQTGNVWHNTITPIARCRNGAFELDLVLRNNRTSEKHVHGIFHAHQEHHHIKKENIGLIEVMGLAVLPARLKEELSRVAAALLTGEDTANIPETTQHAAWVRQVQACHTIAPDTVETILQQEVAAVFLDILKQCGVFKRNNAGQAAFMRFLNTINER